MNSPTQGDLPAYSVVGDRYTFLLTGSQTAGACFVFEALVPPGKGSPPHVHGLEDEGFYVVEGDFEFNVAGLTTRLAAGGFLFGRRGVPHHFTNVGPTPGKLIITVTPAGLEDFFAEVGQRLEGREDRPIPPTEADIARMTDAAPRYGIGIITGQ